jgi:lysozyme
VKALPPEARPLEQHEVTSAITAWALECLHDASLALGDVAGPRRFGSMTLVAHVETHDNPTATNPLAHPHRGITVYQVPDDAAAPTDPAPAPQSTARVLGLDVSAFQPSIHWPTVAAAGRAFAIVKATEGLTVTNAHYIEQIEGAADAGLLVGAYHFFRTTSDAVQQARRFAAFASGLDVPLALDVENQKADEALGGVEPGDFADRVRTCLDELAQLRGVRPLLYISPGFAARLPDRRFYDVADLWVAHYGVRVPTLPVGFERWTLWQSDGRAVVPGVEGTCDADYFAGSLDDLKNYAKGA